MKRVILSTRLMIGDGLFFAETISLEQALQWLAAGPVDNFCGHETVKILGLEPDRSRRSCRGFDEALAVTANDRLEFGREYSAAEIERIGYTITLIRRIAPGSLDVRLPAWEEIERWMR